jgi:hypothetical protein
MKPTIGRIVIYNTTEEERAIMRENSCNVQEKLPAIIVYVWSESCVNLKVFLDGVRDFWITSSLNGDGPRNWNWPVIEK